MLPSVMPFRTAVLLVLIGLAMATVAIFAAEAATRW